MTVPHIVLIDAQNYLHRANVWRTPPSPNSYPLVKSFFTCLRATVAQLRPTRLYLVRDGKPTRQLDLDRSYKLERRREAIEVDNQKSAERVAFFTQCDIALDLVARFMPACLMRHPRYEADDLIATLVDRTSRSVKRTIVSSDTDFVQLLDAHPGLELYNPVTKSCRSAPESYDYLVWKALRGDPGDGITAVPGVGDKTAARLASDPAALENFLLNEATAEKFALNYELIQLAVIPQVELDHVQTSTPTRDWQTMHAQLTGLGLNSMVTQQYWQRFIDTFDPLFGSIDS